MLLPGEVLLKAGSQRSTELTPKSEVIVVAGYEPLQINGGLTAATKD